jgi:FkbM family methyltransferase
MKMSVASGAKHIVREGLRRLGLRVYRSTPATDPEAQVAALLAFHEIDLVLDVGANSGQYAQSLRRSGYRGRILSFEPLQEAWERCRMRASSDPLWTVAPRMALGSAEGAIEIHVADNSFSSSILPMRDSHRAAAPGSAYVGTQTVDLRRLDRAAASDVAGAKRPFLKLDTQGYEREILTGATGILNRVRGVQVEMSLTSLYEGAPSFEELLALLEEMNLRPWAILPGFTDQTSGRMLQVDGLFFREPAP